jgi:hypothetical protein
MEFITGGSGSSPVPQRAMRRLVEIVDACRGQEEVFVVFRDQFPYQATSLHSTAQAAQQAVNAEQGLSYFGPVAPEPTPSGFAAIRKTTGTTFEQFDGPVSRVVLFDAEDNQMAEYNVDIQGLTNPQTDIEALFFTPSSVDKYAIPYVTRVYGVEYAAERRREWIGD